MDERFLAVNVRGKGLVVLTACSHAGVVNVLTHARACFPGVKLHTVLGGLHLSGINERIIPQTVKALHGFDLDVIAAGHCTGWRAMTALANEFGDKKLAPTKFSVVDNGQQIVFYFGTSFSSLKPRRVMTCFGVTQPSNRRSQWRRRSRANPDPRAASPRAGGRPVTPS
jgi:hypothetical protein